MNEPIVIEINDAYDDTTHDVTIRNIGNGVAFSCAKGGVFGSAMIEFRNGKPFLVVWADSESDEPTHQIHLNNRTI
jgi:hypothetical protein